MIYNNKQYKQIKGNMKYSQTTKMIELTNRILEIIENQDEFTQSDLQGAVSAVILDAMNEK